MSGRASEVVAKRYSFIQRFVGVAAMSAAALTWSLSTADAQCGAAPQIPTFGELGVQGFRFDLALAAGLDAHQLIGKTTSWAELQPDGVHFDTTALSTLDREVKEAMADGMKAIVMRVRPGGGGLEPFAGAEATWPLDLATYESKDGEWLGPRLAAGLESQTSFPPRVLTRDEPGNTSPWYEFVKALAARYSGCTLDPDPLYAGRYLPRVDYWSSVHEADVKSFWYGTSKDMFGGVGGDPAVGLLPSFYRAVKAANPAVQVVSGGAASQTLGYYLTFERAQKAGNKYTSSVRSWGKSYFHTSVLLSAVFDLYAGNDAGLYDHYATDPNELRARTLIDAMFSETADDYYDVVGVHFYDNPLMLEDLIAFIRARQRVSKPLWLTELGVVNQSPTFNVDDQARWVAQKMVIAVGNGIEHATYSPMMASIAGATLAPIFDGMPGSISWRPAAYAAQTVANAINEASGYGFSRKRTVNDTTFFEFAQGGGTGHLAFAWRASSSASVDLRATLGIPTSTPIDIVNHLGQAIWTQSPSSTYTIGVSPILIRWSGTTGPGCGRVGDRSQPARGLADFTLVLLPLAWHVARRHPRLGRAQLPLRAFSHSSMSATTRSRSGSFRHS